MQFQETPMPVESFEQFPICQNKIQYLFLYENIVPFVIKNILAFGGAKVMVVPMFPWEYPEDISIVQI